MKNTNFFYGILFVSTIFIGIIFHNWFSVFPLSSGDWGFRYSESIKSSFYMPQAWDPFFGYGLGTNTIFLLALNTYFIASAKFLHEILHFDWVAIERIVWFYPFLFLVLAGPFLLARKLLKSRSFSIVSSVVYATNTYALMIASGGQLGIGMAYAIFPMVVLSSYSIFCDILEDKKNSSLLIRHSLYLAILLTSLILFDLRIAYVGIMFFILFYLPYGITKHNKINKKKFFKIILYVLFIPTLVSFLIHSLWLIPYFIVGQSPLEQLGEIYTSVGAVKFFSFTFFENSISLLHPNWPENLFGKVSFMRPEFLLLPVIAFSILLYKKIENKSLYILFAMLALLAAFLAKGANEPFGNVYILFFQNIPFFQMFRDSTKWFILIALLYSQLIPLGLLLMHQRLRIPKLFLVIFFLVFWLFTIRQVFMGIVGGTFRPHRVPFEYNRFKDLVIYDTKYYRTLWIPALSRYTYYDFQHPAMSFESMHKTSSPSAVLAFMNKDETQKILQSYSIRYVVVPYDSIGEIFVKDRKYYNHIYNQFVNNLSNVPYLTKIQGFHSVIIYELKNYKPHFFVDDSRKELPVQVLKNEPTRYVLQLSQVYKGDRLIFSEKYDNLWILRNKNGSMHSTKYNEELNSFVLNKSGNYQVTLEYSPQKLVVPLFIFSLVILSATAIIIGLTYFL